LKHQIWVQVGQGHDARPSVERLAMQDFDEFHPVALRRVALRAHRLQVVEVIGTPARARPDVVKGEPLRRAAGHAAVPVALEHAPSPLFSFRGSPLWPKVH
jgi:hypothetical protein